MNDFTNILSQAKKMQDKMKEVQDNIKKIEVEGSSGGNGNYEMKSIFMDENTKKENDQIKNDLIIAAYNDAKDKLKKKMSEEVSKATGVPNLPFDIKLPF